MQTADFDRVDGGLRWPTSLPARATKLAYQHGGITKAISTLISPVPVPRNAAALELLRGNHSSEDQTALAACKAAISGGA